MHASGTVGADTGEKRTAQGWSGETAQNHLYKPFLRGSLVTVLTVGCTLGAINLAVMGFGADLKAVWGPLIQGHAYAQIFGWVGLFIMGVAYHIVPRFYLRPLTRPGLVLPSFVLAGSGLVLRFITQPFAEQPAAGWLMAFSSALGLAGVSLFLWAMYDTMRRGEDRFGSPADRLFIGTGFVWLWLISAATLFITIYLALEGRSTIEQALNAPYLRAALSGAIVTLILGFTLRTVPHMLGRQVRRVGLLQGVLGAYTLGVIAQIVSEAIRPRDPAALLALLGAGLEALSLVAFVAVLGLYSLKPTPRRALARRNPWPERYVRTAYLWLLAAAAMNLAFAIGAAAGRPAPHAFVAGYHHALTVGFISMMIVGMSMRLVPVFIGAMNKQQRLAAAVFVALLAGNSARIVGQGLAHLYGGTFYVLMGLSGLIEVGALALYASALWRAMSRPSYGQEAAKAKAGGKAPGGTPGRTGSFGLGDPPVQAGAAAPRPDPTS